MPISRDRPRSRGDGPLGCAPPAAPLAGCARAAAMVLPQDDEWLDEDEDYETQELWDKRLARAGENLEEFRELENEEARAPPEPTTAVPCPCRARAAPCRARLM